MTPGRLLVLSAPAALLLSCVTTPKAPPKPPDFELVQGAVQLVVDDPAEDLLYVRMGGRITVLSADDRAKELPSAPDLSALADRTRATIDTSRGVRFFDPERGWMRVTQRGPLPLAGPWQWPLPEWSVLDGVLVELPFAGPDQGRLRPRCVLDGGGLPEGAVLSGRDDSVVFASKGTAGFVDPFDCTVVPVGSKGFSPLPVRPALAPDATLAAFAFRRDDAVAVADSAGKVPARLPRYAVVLASQRELVATLALGREPLAIHFGAGALFVEVTNDVGGRQFARHAFARSIPFDAGPRDKALKRHGDGLRVRIRESLDANDVVDAVDMLDLLRADGLADHVTSDDAALASEVADRVRPLLLDAAKKAVSSGESSLAAVIDRRAQLLVGKSVLEENASLPSLQLAFRATPLANLAAAKVDALFARGDWMRRVDQCKPKSERASGIACLSIELSTGTLDPGGSLRALAQSVARRKQGCPTDGPVLVEPGPAGPRSLYTCDAEQAVLGDFDGFRALAARRDRDPLLVTATFDDGTTEKFELPRFAMLDDAEGALELVLMMQTRRDRALALATTGAEAELADAARHALRTLAWRRAPFADDDIRRAIAGDGQVRTGWLRTR